jgi:tight adherence protein B
VTELYTILFVLAIGLAFACCELSSLWWILPLCLVLISLKLSLTWGFLAAITLLSPLFLRRFREKQRIRQLQKSLPELIEFLANCLRAGMTIEASFLECDDSKGGPQREITRSIKSQLSLGASLEDTLKSQANNWPQVALMKQFASAVALSRQSGMDAGKLFDSLASDARADLAAQERLLSLSAQARLQAWVMGLLPFALLALMSFLEPERVETFLQDPRGRAVIVFIFLLEFIAVIWIKRLIRI